MNKRESPLVKKAEDLIATVEDLKDIINKAMSNMILHQCEDCSHLYDWEKGDDCYECGGDRARVTKLE